MDIVYDLKMDDLINVVNQVEYVVQFVSPPQPQHFLQTQVLAPPQLNSKPNLKPQPKHRQQPKKNDLENC